MPRTRLAVIVLLCSLVPGIASSNELRIAVAANFAPTLKLLKPVFEKENGIRITIIKGSTGKLFAQIIHGAPYDVFLAADQRRPRLLEQKNLTSKQGRTTYAIGQIALWSGQPDRSALEALKQASFRRIAIANPKTAPYGAAAIQVMQHLALYDTVKPNLVTGENISQAFQFVQSGNAELGFVAYPDIKRHNIKQYWLPDTTTYKPLEQQMVILKRSRHQALAHRFARFMVREDIKQMLRQQGYIAP